MIDIMENNSVYRNMINWTSFRATVLAAAVNAKTESDTYPAIAIALGLLGENHGYYIGATGHYVFSPSVPSCTAPSFQQSPSVPAAVGYVYAGACSTGCNSLMYATAVQGVIQSADNASIVGWIVDLRSNTGGNFYAMLVGVGPILGDGIAGYFIDADQDATPWAYSNGAGTLGGVVTQSAVAAPYTLLHPNPPVALLIDNLTGSAGEATAISFLGRPNTRTFGTATCGVSTGLSSYGLVDGATLVLTTVIDADRLMRKYGGQIIPDETITNPSQVVTSAIAWLQGQASQVSARRNAR